MLRVKVTQGFYNRNIIPYFPSGLVLVRLLTVFLVSRGAAPLPDGVVGRESLLDDGVVGDDGHGQDPGVGDDSSRRCLATVPADVRTHWEGRQTERKVRFIHHLCSPLCSQKIRV